MRCTKTDAIRSPHRREQAAMRGTSRPSNFAVFKLTVVWYFTGACTGRFFAAQDAVDVRSASRKSTMPPAASRRRQHRRQEALCRRPPARRHSPEERRTRFRSADRMRAALRQMPSAISCAAKAPPIRPVPTTTIFFTLLLLGRRRTGSDSIGPRAALSGPRAGRLAIRRLGWSRRPAHSWRR